jgi:tRNA A37 threonylcarbamoyltransferase TsaD
MKSQVSFLLEKLKKEDIELTEELIYDIAYDFQEAVVEVLAKKLIHA